MSKMTTEELLAYDPLLFWPRHAHMFPIFARLAQRFLASAPTSCNVEEFSQLWAEYVRHYVPD
jgi:hypothetical protein